jgi:hypothetical protein
MAATALDFWQAQQKYLAKFGERLPYPYQIHGSYDQLIDLINECLKTGKPWQAPAGPPNYIY